MATTEELQARVRAEYPAYAYLLAIPEVAALLLEAVDPDRGFSPQEFTAKLQATEWYRTHGEVSRQWDAFVNADPASAQRQIDARMSEIRNLIGEMGVPIGENELPWLADWSLRFGIAPGSTEMQDMLAGAFDRPGAREAAGGGSFGAALTEIRRMGREEYLVPVSETDAYNWARLVTSGDLSIESVRNAMRDLAKGKFSHLSDLIDQGVAPGTYFAPYRQMIAQELEIGSEQVDLTDARWADILSYAPTTGVKPTRTDAGIAGVRSSFGAGGLRSMTLAEAQQFVRRTPEWDRTSRARSMAAGLGTELLRTFGGIA